MVKVLNKTGLAQESSQSGQNMSSIICDGGRHSTVPLKTVLNSHLRNRKAICEEYNLDCTTLVQPVAGTHGIHREAEHNDKTAKELRHKFEHLETTFSQNGAVFVTNALDNFTKHAFIDYFHHSAAANREIAKYISTKLQLE